MEKLKLKSELRKKLIVGTKIRIGKLCSEKSYLKEGEMIELIEGVFECDNGLYCYNEMCPSILRDDEDDEFDSIYHLFGNDLENFLDSEIITNPPKEK